MSMDDESWNLLFCAGYIVHPCKDLETEEVERLVRGSQTDIDAIPSAFFLPLFSRSANEYPIEVAFISEGQAQRNEVRTLVRSIAFDEPQKREDASRKLALRLATVTDKRSQPGLLVILVGQKESSYRVLLWKFPSDESLQAIMSAQGITIKLTDDAFSRRSTYFKAAMFEGTMAETSLWRGAVEDKQAKQRVTESAEFWIADFLAARSVLTDVHGTRIAGKALKKIIDKTDVVETKEQLVAAARVLKTQGDRNISFSEVANDYLPEESRNDFLEAVGGPEIAEGIFRLDPQTLETELRVKYIVLNRKFTVRGPLDEFDEGVRVVSTGEVGEVEVSLRGKITSQSVKTR